MERGTLSQVAQAKRLSGKIADPDRHDANQSSGGLVVGLCQTRVVAQSHPSQPFCAQIQTLCGRSAFSVCGLTSLAGYSLACVRGDLEIPVE